MQLNLERLGRSDASPKHESRRAPACSWRAHRRSLAAMDSTRTTACRGHRRGDRLLREDRHAGCGFRSVGGSVWQGFLSLRPVGGSLFRRGWLPVRPQARSGWDRPAHCGRIGTKMGAAESCFRGASEAADEEALGLSPSTITSRAGRCWQVLTGGCSIARRRSLFRRLSRTPARARQEERGSAIASAA